MIEALAESLNSVWSGTKDIDWRIHWPVLGGDTYFKRLSEFVSKSKELCLQLENLELEMRENSLQLPQNHKMLEHLCRDARKRSWTQVIPFIEGDKSKSLERASLAMGMLKDIQALSTDSNHRSVQQGLRSATCKVVERALFCRFWTSCWFRRWKCTPLVEDDVEDDELSCKCQHTQREQTANFEPCKDRHERLDGVLWNCGSDRATGQCICRPTEG